MKITSKDLKDKFWFIVYEEIVNKGFKLGYDLNFSRVRKVESYNYALIVDTSLEQVSKIK